MPPGVSLLLPVQFSMKRYTTLVFDLDGTLTDPGVGITNSVAYALQRFGITVADRSELFPFIGPPLADSFAQSYGFSPADVRRAVALYREYYSDRGIFENRLYDGVPELLQWLRAAGVTLLVATSKPEPYAVQILEHFALNEAFTCITGSHLDGTRVDKAEVIACALDTAGITEKASTLMVGDRKFDLIGAQTVGIDSLAVLFGYGSRAELESAGATYLAEHVDDIRRFSGHALKRVPCTT